MRVAAARIVSIVSTASGSFHAGSGSGNARWAASIPSPFSASRISHETNGMNGWSMASESSSTRRRTARVFAFSPSGTDASRRPGFTIST